MQFLEGQKYAIIKWPGFTGYVDRMTKLKYMPTTYYLVEKGVNHWGGLFKAVHTGHINKAKCAELEFILEQADSGALAKVLVRGVSPDAQQTAINELLKVKSGK